MQRLSFISRSLFALASSLFLFIGGIGLPAAGFVLLPFVPQPILSFGVRYGMGWGVGVLIAACILLAVLGGKELAYIYGIFAVAAALLFVLLGRLRAIELLVSAVAAVVFASAGTLLFYLFGSWAVLLRDLRESLTQHMTSALSAYEKMGLSKEGLDVLKEQIPRIAETLFQLLPGLVFLSLVFVVLINVLFLCRRFPERSGEWLSNVNLREWKGPEPLVWGLIACGFALFAPGLEFIAFFFHKNNVPRFLRGVTYLLIVIQQILTLMVVGLGLFDLWGDFRRLRKNNLTPSQAA
jgi:uncharacterized protein YybS (DUF2232 family)